MVTALGDLLQCFLGPEVVVGILHALLSGILHDDLRSGGDAHRAQKAPKQHEICMCHGHDYW